MAEPVLKKQKEEIVKAEMSMSPVVRITTGGKINKYCDYCIKVLGLESGAVLLEEISVYGEGNAISKSITVVEILKRKYPDRLTQTSTISMNEEKKLPKLTMNVKIKR